MTETYCKKRQHEIIEQENYKYEDMEKENINQEYMAPESNRRLRILLVLTGGTIGTMSGSDGKRRVVSNAGSEPLLLTSLRRLAPEYEPEADIRIPYQVLSEHMTTDYLNALGDCLRGEEMSRYDGIFITHGSDTLAFTAAYLAELLRGCPVPVFLLASQRPLDDSESNGTENFLAALKLLGHTPEPGVFVTYRNSDGIMYLHRAEELRQCEPGTDDFFSEGMRPCGNLAGGEISRVSREEELPEEGSEPEMWKVPDLRITNDVLLLHPYVGIRYDCIVTEGVRAVLHTLYHSSTAPKELAGFLDRCRKAKIPCYILPCEPENCHYETTSELLANGAIPLSGMTEETAYMRLLMQRI